LLLVWICVAWVIVIVRMRWSEKNRAPGKDSIFIRIPWNMIWVGVRGGKMPSPFGVQCADDSGRTSWAE